MTYRFIAAASLRLLKKWKNISVGTVAYALALEVGVPDEPRASAEIESHGAVAVVHRQHKAVAFNAALVAESLSQSFAESQRRVFNSVVLVDIEVAFSFYGKVESRMRPIG